MIETESLLLLLLSSWHFHALHYVYASLWWTLSAKTQCSNQFSEFPAKYPNSSATNYILSRKRTWPINLIHPKIPWSLIPSFSLSITFPSLSSQFHRLSVPKHSIIFVASFLFFPSFSLIWDNNYMLTVRKENGHNKASIIITVTSNFFHCKKLNIKSPIKLCWINIKLNIKLNLN